MIRCECGVCTSACWLLRCGSESWGASGEAQSAVAGGCTPVCMPSSSEGVSVCAKLVAATLPYDSEGVGAVEGAASSCRVSAAACRSSDSS